MATGSSDGAKSQAGVRRAALILALALFSSLGVGSARADLWVKEKLTGGDGKPLGERTWIFAPGKIRFDEGTLGFVLDVAQGKGWLYGVEGGGCEALPLPTEASTAAAASDPHTQHLGSVLSEAGRAGGQLLFRNETKTIGKFQADRYEVVGAGGAVQERWIASSIKNDDFHQVVQDWTGSGVLTSLMGFEPTQILLQGSGLGYPVKIRDLRTGLVVEAVEIRTAKLGAAAFTPPPACAGR